MSSIESGKIVIQDVTGELPGLDATPAPGEPGTGPTDTNQTGPNDTGQQGAQPDVNLGTLVRVLDPQGRATYVSPAFRALTLPSASFTQPLRGGTWQGTVITRNGQAVRVYSVALSDHGKIFGVLQVGESLAPLTATSQSILIALLIVIPFVLLLGAVGSYWLAKRAFRPMLHLTRTAREMQAGDLHRRVPVPRSRDEVYDLALTLNEMIGRLDQAFARQRRFVADASHELRTPVTVIRSIADVALEDVLTPEEYGELLRDISAEAERLGTLINDLLVLARADEGQMVLDQAPVRLDLLALDVAAAMEPLANERGIAFQTQTLEPATVSGDTARLIQVLMGLVDNALTYTNAGGTVALRVAVRKTMACVTVYDTGIGIAPRDIPLIFERFYRADPARSRAAGGSGLGLAIARRVIEAHGGSIEVESQVGQGSTFTVLLPLAPSPGASRQTSTVTPAQSPTAEKPPHRY